MENNNPNLVAFEVSVNGVVNREYTVNLQDARTFPDGLYFSKHGDAIRIYPHSHKRNYLWVTMEVTKKSSALKLVETEPEIFFLEEIDSIKIIIDGKEMWTIKKIKIIDSSIDSPTV